MLARVAQITLSHGFVLLATCIFAGCGRGKAPELAHVTGTVTRDGKPLANLLVNFQPEQGRPSWGLTDARGRFKLYYSREDDGARLGRHRVFVQFNDSQPQSFAGPGEDSPAEGMQYEATVDDEPPAPQPTAIDALSPEERRAIIEEYGNPEKTPLKVDVEKDGQVIDLKLD